MLIRRFRHKMRPRGVKRLSERRGVDAMLGVICALGVVVLCLFGFAYILKFVGAGGGAAGSMAGAALIAGCFAGGFTAAKHRRKDGLKIGFITGLIVYCVIFFVGAIFFKHFTSLSLITKFIMIAVAASIGGICGVNTKYN